MLTIPVELVDEGTTCREGAVAGVQGSSKILSDKIRDLDEGGIPAAVVDSAVKPVDVSVRARDSSDVR